MILILTSTTEVLNTLYVILGAIGLAVIVFGLSSIILWYVLKNREKKVYREFDRILPVEQKRAARTEEIYQEIRSRKLHCKEEFAQEFEKVFAEVKQASDPASLRRCKDTIDFAELYLAKVLRTYGRGKSDQDKAEELLNMRKLNDDAYLPFAKACATYNAVLSMWPTRLANRLHRQANRRTKIGLF